MDENVCITNSTNPYLKAHRTQNYVYDRLLYFAKAHNIEESEVDYWYSAFESIIHETQIRKIDFDNYNVPINIEESISTIEDILSGRYG